MPSKLIGVPEIAAAWGLPKKMVRQMLAEREAELVALGVSVEGFLHRRGVGKGFRIKTSWAALERFYPAMSQPGPHIALVDRVKALETEIAQLRDEVVDALELDKLVKDLVRRVEELEKKLSPAKSK